MKGNQRKTLILDKELVKKCSSKSLTKINDSQYENIDLDDDDDDDDDDANYNQNSSTNFVRNILKIKTNNNRYRVGRRASNLIRLIKEKETNDDDLQMISSPQFSSQKRISTIYNEKKEVFVKLTEKAIQLVMAIQSFETIDNNNNNNDYDDEKDLNEELLDITVQFKLSLHHFKNEIIKIGMTIPMDLFDNGEHHHHHHHHPTTRIFYFMKEGGPRQIMHILADCIYKFGDNFNIPLMLYGLNLLHLSIVALKKKILSIENNKAEKWPSQLTKMFFNWSADALNELALSGAIPLLAKIISSSINSTSSNIQTLAYSVIQQLVIASENCIYQMLFDPPIKEKASQMTVIDKLRELNKRNNSKKLSHEEELLKMKKTVEADFRLTLHEKDVREGLSRQTFKKIKLKTILKKETVTADTNIPVSENFSFIDYGNSSCIKMILTTAIYNQNRHEVLGSFASLIWVLINATSDVKIIEKICSTSSNKYKVDKLKKPYKSYKDTKKKLTLNEQKEQVVEQDESATEVKQKTVLEFLLDSLIRFHPLVLENSKENNKLFFASYQKICKAIYALMITCETAYLSIMTSSKKKVIVKTFELFTNSQSMKNDISILKEKMKSEVLETLQNQIPTSVLKARDDSDKLKTISRSHSAPSHRIQKSSATQNINENGQDNQDQRKEKYSRARPKSASAVSIFDASVLGDAPSMPKKIRMQLPAINSSISILTDEQKMKQLADHKKAFEMAILLQDALTPKKLKDEEFKAEIEVNSIEVNPIPFGIENNINHDFEPTSNIESDPSTSTLRKFEDNIEYDWNVFQDEDFDKTINDVLLIRSIRNAIDNGNNMIEFMNTINSNETMRNISNYQLNRLCCAIKDKANHKDLLKILNE